MQKMQRMGFMLSSATFLLIGIIFLIVGFAAENDILKKMGAIWLPLGTVNFLLVIFMLKREK